MRTEYLGGNCQRYSWLQMAHLLPFEKHLCPRARCFANEGEAYLALSVDYYWILEPMSIGWIGAYLSHPQLVGGFLHLSRLTGLDAPLLITSSTEAKMSQF